MVYSDILHEYYDGLIYFLTVDIQLISRTFYLEILICSCCSL